MPEFEVIVPLLIPLNKFPFSKIYIYFISKLNCSIAIVFSIKKKLKTVKIITI